MKIIELTKFSKNNNITIKDCNNGIYKILQSQAKDDFNSLMSGKLNPDGYWGRDNKPYNLAFEFINEENIIIDGHGETIIFKGLIQPFEFIGCKNIVIKNLTIDWERPGFTEGEIVGVDPNELIIKVDEGYCLQGNEPVWAMQDYDVVKNRLGYNCLFRSMSNIEKLDEGLVKVKYKGDEVFNLGDKIILRHIGNYRPGFHFNKCQNIRMENVTINNAVGMGIIGHQSHNFIANKLVVKPSGNRIMSTTTDATHFISCTGHIQFNNCYFEGMGDDAVNVHGFYYYITKILDSYTFEAELKIKDGTQNQLMDTPDDGDEIELVRGDTLKEYFQGNIKNVQIDEENWKVIIRIKEELPKDLSLNDLMANATKVAKLNFDQCLVKNIRARGLLIQNRGVNITNSKFYNCTGTGIHIDTADGWMESIGTRDVVINNNEFINCGYGDGTYENTSGIVVMTECKEQAVGVHKNITISNNKIIAESDIGIYIACAENVTLANNNITNCKQKVKIQSSNFISVE